MSNYNYTAIEKLEMIRGGAETALEKIAEARTELESVMAETGYDYGYQIMQELREEMMSGLATSLANYTNGDMDQEIMDELRPEDDEDIEADREGKEKKD